jgi:hypothetical protein
MWAAASESGSPLSGSDSMTASAIGGMMADGSKRLRALGYLRKHLLMTETEVRYAKERLIYFAQVAGFQLDTVYVEDVETWPAAFEALVEAATSDELSAVLLPSMLHFAVLGPPANIKKHFEHITRTRVLTVPELVSHSPGEVAS